MTTHDPHHVSSTPPIPPAAILPEARHHAEQVEELGDRLTVAGEAVGVALTAIGDASDRGEPWARHLAALHLGAGRLAALADMAQHSAEALLSLSERLSGGYLAPNGAGPWEPPSDPSDAASGC